MAMRHRLNVWTVVPWLLLICVIAAIILELRVARERTVAGSPATVSDFRLNDYRHRPFSLYDQTGAKAVVLIAHADGCPIVQQGVPTIEDLSKRFTPKGVRFFYVNAQDTASEVAHEAKRFSCDIPILMDTTQKVSRALSYSRSSEAIVVDPRTWTIAYRGAIDDRLGYGVHFDVAKHNYLADALQSLLDGRPIEVSHTEPQGCIINYSLSR